MGPVNEARVKVKLRDIRRALTAQNPPRWRAPDDSRYDRRCGAALLAHRPDAAAL